MQGRGLSRKHRLRKKCKSRSQRDSRQNQLDNNFSLGNQLDTQLNPVTPSLMETQPRVRAWTRYLKSKRRRVLIKASK